MTQPIANISRPVRAFNAGAMASTNVITSPWIWVNGFKNFGFMFFWTGTPTGTIAINVSNDIWSQSGQGAVVPPIDPSAAPIPPIPQFGIPLTLTGLSPSFNQPSGSAGQQWLDLQTNPAWMQLQYTNQSGTGSLWAYVRANP